MQFSPLFINTTRWGLAYGGPGGRWGAARVQPLVDQVAQALGVANLQGRSLLPARDDSKDLDYIPAAARPACQLQNRNLFDRAVGSADGNAGCNGQTRLADFRCAFTAVNGVWSTLQNMQNPWLTINDSNGCHHLSLLLAERAFAGVGAGVARIIINIDAHADFGTVLNASSLRCDNWGLYCVRAVDQIYLNPIADVYVGVGNRTRPNPPWSNTFARLRSYPGAPAPPAQTIAGATLADQVATLLALLQANAAAMNNGNPWAGYAVYVTIDRDVEQSSFTDYKDGPYTVQEAWAAVQQCLTALRGAGATFAGFDICGLPTHGGQGTPDGWSNQQKIGQALQDITTLSNAVAAL